MPLLCCCVCAQVVHIDLGIAFEQGLFLQTPERVPFRLTANIVDGMGAAGVEGTFRRCCETTMQVSMRASSAVASCCHAAT
jgi:ataxia telangiectasia mutated family protein